MSSQQKDFFKNVAAKTLKCDDCNEIVANVMQKFLSQDNTNI